jgi:hypothetical protein
MFAWQRSSCSVLSWVPSEICAGRLCRGEGETEPKQIGEGTQDSTEEQDCAETVRYFQVNPLAPSSTTHQHALIYAYVSIHHCLRREPLFDAPLSVLCKFTGLLRISQ